MSSSLWIDLQKDSEVPVLLEYQTPYEQIHSSQALQMLLVIRGPNSDSPHQQIHFHREPCEERGLIIECALHLKQNLDSRVHCNAPGSVKYHPLDMIHNKHSLSSSKIAHSFYSLALAPIATCIAFVRGEFEKIDDIINILALWASIRENTCQTTRPTVLIIGTNRSDQDLEHLLTAEVSSICRPFRCGTKEDFRNLWGRCFSNIFRGLASASSISLCSVYQQALDISGHSIVFPTTERLVSLMKITCAHFSSFPGLVLTPTSVFRKSPISDRLRLQVAKVFNLGLARDLASSLAVCWLIQDTHTEGIEVTVWPTSQIFDENYSDVIASLHTSDAMRVRKLFIKLANSRQPKKLLLNTLYNIGRYLLKQKHRNDTVNVSSMCLPCLTHYPSLTLTCGHRFCRRCVQNLSNYRGSAEFQLTHCILCGVANNAPIYIKPSSAGLRILKLSGGFKDTANLVQAVKQLERALDCPIHLHFDLIIGTGIGKVLSRSMFHKDGKIKDFFLCISDPKKVQWEGWQFPDAGGPKLNTITELPNNRLTILADCTRSVAKHLWPLSKIDANLWYSGVETENTIIQHAQILTAALFYPELQQIHKSQNPPLLTLVIRCRHGPGPRLLNLVKKMADSWVELEYYCQGWKSVKFCSADIYVQANDGKPFGKPLIVQARSDGRIEMALKGGMIGREARNLSNCPCSVSRLEKTQHT